jgi:predicted nucleic acid-binding protein
MKPKVYLETTIPSYLAARPSRDLVVAAHQEVTREWWETRRAAFDVFVSEFVLDEATSGDPEAARRRLELLAGIPLLDPTGEVDALANAILTRIGLPQKASRDSLHIAIATANGMDYLLTWNCSHIANAEFREPIGAVCRGYGFEPPIICTPDELLKEPP